MAKKFKWPKLMGIISCKRTLPSERRFINAVAKKCEGCAFIEMDISKADPKKLPDAMRLMDIRGAIVSKSASKRILSVAEKIDRSAKNSGQVDIVAFRDGLLTAYDTLEISLTEAEKGQKSTSALAKARLTALSILKSASILTSS